MRPSTSLQIVFFAVFLSAVPMAFADTTFFSQGYRCEGSTIFLKKRETRFKAAKVILDARIISLRERIQALKRANAGKGRILKAQKNLSSVKLLLNQLRSCRNGVINSQSATPVPTAVSSPTAVPTSLNTPTSTPVPTTTATPSQTPTRTPTSTPTSTSTPDGNSTNEQVLSKLQEYVGTYQGPYQDDSLPFGGTITLTLALSGNHLSGTFTKSLGFPASYDGSAIVFSKDVLEAAFPVEVTAMTTPLGDLTFLFSGSDMFSVTGTRIPGFPVNSSITFSGVFSSSGYSGRYTTVGIMGAKGEFYLAKQ